MIYEQLLQQSGDQMLREAKAQVTGEGRLHSTLRRLT